MRNKQMLKILAIGAHPDDIELGCAGTILSIAKSDGKAWGLILTNGEKSGDPEIRRKEAINAGKILKMEKMFFSDLLDTRVEEGIETISVIENMIETVKPDTVITHSLNDTHQDHRNCARATISAARNVPTIISFEPPSLTPMFQPTLYVDMSSTFNEKIRALQQYVSQNDKEFLKIDAIKGLAKFRGYQAKVEYAEAFEVVKMILNLSSATF
jgi:LmbE family N-acetylglucosaminyl deacetylase